MKKNNLYKNFIFLFFLLCSGVNALGLEGNFIQGGLVYGKLEQDDYLGSDQATISNGILTFTKLNKSFEMENDIQSKNREKINFKTEDGLNLISANLDLASDGETEPMAIVGSTSKNKDGNYYAEGPWDDEGKEIIGIAFKLKN